MTGRRAILGLCMLCALAISAVAAQGASAAGTTAYTCVKGAGTLAGSHCLAGAGEYGHVSITNGTTPEITGTNANTASETTAAEPSILKVTIAGTPLELKATGVGGTGTMSNSESGGEMIASGTGTIVYTGVTVVKPEKECTVRSAKEGTVGTVTTKGLKATTAGQGDNLKFEPAEGTTFATFWVECKQEVPEALLGEWTVSGSVKCPATGATTICNHAEVTTANTLKAKGSKAGLEGKLTISGRANSSEGYTPLAATT